MTFFSIIYKNLRYNFKRYILYFLVNSFIVSILFMYGSLMFNDILIRELGQSSICKILKVFSMRLISTIQPLGHSSIYKIMRIAFGSIVVFSILFISYINISFIKYRRKEISIFLTLGMTTKGLIKMILLENTAIVLGSLITGITTGAVFLNLFYMSLKKVLMSENIFYNINYKIFILSAGIFLITFLTSAVFNVFYIHKLSIIELIKSSSSKEAGKLRTVLGILSLLIFIVSVYYISNIVKNDGNMIALGFFIGVALISPYWVIDSSIGEVKSIFNKFPNLCNKNLLMLSNLSYKFSAIIYIVSLAVGGSIFLIGFSYSLYSSVEEQTNANCPYDIMFVESDKYNHISQDKVKEIIESKGGKIEDYKVLECIKLSNYKKLDGKIEYNSPDSIIISESNYNNTMNSNLDIKKGEAIIIKGKDEKYYDDSDDIFTLDGEEKAKVREKIFDKNNYATLEAFFNTVKNESIFIISKDNKKYISESITIPKDGFIINDMDYNSIKIKVGESAIFKNHLINLNKINSKKIFYGLLDDLVKVNGGDKNIWQISNFAHFEESSKKSALEAYRPLLKQEEFELNLKQKGFFFFTSVFSGIMFLIFSWVVLYYKIITDAEEEKKRISIIMKIGMTKKEIDKILLKELKIVFIVPIMIGGGLALYYLSAIYSMTTLFNTLMEKSIIIVMIYAILQILFYFISKRRYLNEVLK